MISYIFGSVVAPPILEVSKLGCVRGDRRLFSGLDFSLPAGTYLQVTGPNGSGKTSLLRILCRLLAPAEGVIKWHGENIRSLDEDYFTFVTYLGHRHGVKDELSAIENLRISTALNG
ncbi:MAG TPA: ATP-binding cassette domain-containing protein, partial [Pyrinomonadaceae bacterium]|nr:ATP-binding cassette domain-containing protein [Pyrinomonadaceae bacterium]